MKIIFPLFCLMTSVANAFAFNDPFVKNEIPRQIQAFIPVHYADAGSLSQSLNNSQLNLLSPSGKAYADVRSNQLYIKDDPEHFQKIQQYIQKMDIPLQQILISAKIVSIDNNYTRNLGVIFNFKDSDSNSIKIPIIKFSNTHLLNLQIHALEEEGHANVLSKPEIITLNRQSATIESGDEIPYQESTSSGATSVTFKKAVLKLKVNPVILPQNQLLLNIQINEDKVSSLKVNGVPAIRTEQLSTAAMMHSGQTIVLGGIFETTRSQSRSGLPLINKIPLIGQVLSEKHQRLERKELLIFIRPKILFQ